MCNMTHKPLVAIHGTRRLVRADNGFEIYNLEREPVKPIGRLVRGQIKDGYEYDPDVIWAKEILGPAGLLDRRLA